MAESENILLHRFVATGDAAAFSEIVRRHAGLVYGACLRVLEDKDKAADATQETFFQLLRHAGQITGSIPAWLHRVATGKAVDLIRKDSSRRQREAEYADLKHHEATKWEDLSRYVDEALNDLDDQTRAILIQYFFEGRSMTDLAGDRGISHPTVSRRIESGVTQLREKLRRRGVIVAAATLGSLLGQNAAEAAPALVLKELGKMALVGGKAAVASAGGSAATTSGAKVLPMYIGITTTAKVKIIAAAAAIAVAVGGVVTYKHITREPKQADLTPATSMQEHLPAGNPRTTSRPGKVSANPDLSEAAPPSQDAPKVAATEEKSRTDATPMGYGGFSYGMAMAGTRPVENAESKEIDLSSPKATITSFAKLLAAGDLDRMAECFIDGAEDLGDMREIMQSDDPRFEEEKRVLESIGPPIEITDTREHENGLGVTWTFTVNKAFTIREGGTEIVWEAGDTFEMDARLVNVAGKWLIAGI
jgi:RNA polymerase sigma factor (sigma-70 family)